MANDHLAKNKHARAGRATPGGIGSGEERGTNAEGEPQQGEPVRTGELPTGYKSEQASDVPGVKRKI